MNRLNAFIFIALGGLSGSYCRYLVGRLVSKLFSTVFPFGAFAVNILGSFLIGIFYALSKDFSWFFANLSLLLITGFCGGFTTFSSFTRTSISYKQITIYISPYTASLVLLWDYWLSMSD